MGKCYQCQKELLAGYALCRECKESAKLLLQKFIGELAEEIVLEHTGACGYCALKSCASQQSGLTCLHGVRSYLMERADVYAEKLSRGAA